MGIVDYTSRLAADVLKTCYLRTLDESRIYAALVWALIVVGITVLLAGFSQPIALLITSAVSAGFMMFIYSILLILINRRSLPAPIRVSGFRLAALIWSVGLFGVLSALTFRDQIIKLLG
ncbi:Nramp family divalent metal transporter [Phenylobacterium sp. J367]|uniref:Nramp family divalent metal transporter n=1 Tax=Phenylobacterium sp. J367 TaxID=2898435 RepID=UPI0021508540|nr:Nramp family divalent metal transporter [Phenylobacterium sp. J367]MCR5881114.1 Nramp family divalent metal transporter [Phenylobacterium sp. J367]